MNQNLYPTKQLSTSDNFQSFTVTNDYTVKRTRYQIHKAKRLGKIFSSEHRKLLSDNLLGNLSERMRIQKLLAVTGVSNGRLRPQTTLHP